MTKPEEITNEYMRELLSTLSHFIPANEQMLRNDVIDVIINLREGKVNMVPHVK